MKQDYCRAMAVECEELAKEARSSRLAQEWRWMAAEWLIAAGDGEPLNGTTAPQHPDAS